MIIEESGRKEAMTSEFFMIHHHHPYYHNPAILRKADFAQSSATNQLPNENKANGSKYFFIVSSLHFERSSWTKCNIFL